MHALDVNGQCRDKADLSWSNFFGFENYDCLRTLALALGMAAPILRGAASCNGVSFRGISGNAQELLETVGQCDGSIPSRQYSCILSKTVCMAGRKTQKVGRVF